MTNNYAIDYPDKGNGKFLYKGVPPKNLTELASTPAYKAVFALPFKEYVITIVGFSNGTNVFRDQKHGLTVAEAQKAIYTAEYDEVYALTEYLYNTYKGTGKVFILKNWEGDWFSMRCGTCSGGDPGTNTAVIGTLADNHADMVNWLSARQDAVADARAMAGNPSTVAVLNAVESNLVLDANKGLARVVNKVLPNVMPDMATYSSYDSTSEKGVTKAEIENAFKAALDILYAQSKDDPLGLGKRRILVSEYGLHENKNHRTAAMAKTQITTVLSTAKAWGTSGAYLWELYDNQCNRTGQGEGPGKTVAPTATNPGAAGYPKNTDCIGNWYIKPDGSVDPAAAMMKSY
jgi:hypothetical protein